MKLPASKILFSEDVYKKLGRFNICNEQKRDPEEDHPEEDQKKLLACAKCFCTLVLS